MQTKSAIENIFVGRIALHYLKLFRLAKAEAEFMKNCLQSGNLFMDIPASLIDLNSRYLDQNHIKRLMEIYCRYETATENRFYRAIKELKEYRQQKCHE